MEYTITDTTAGDRQLLGQRSAAVSRVGLFTVYLVQLESCLVAMLRYGGRSARHELFEGTKEKVRKERKEKVVYKCLLTYQFSTVYPMPMPKQEQNRQRGPTDWSKQSGGVGLGPCPHSLLLTHQPAQVSVVHSDVRCVGPLLGKALTKGQRAM